MQVIKNDIKRYYSVETDSHDTNSEDDGSNSQSKIDKNMMNAFIMNVSEFDAILGKLPKIFDHYKVKYELEDGKIVINVVPADIHARAFHALSSVIEAWGNNNAIEDTIEPPLENTGDVCITLRSSFCLLLSLSVVATRKEIPRFLFHAERHHLPSSENQTKYLWTRP